MKTILPLSLSGLISLAALLSAVSCSNAPDEPIVFGTDILASEQIRESRALAEHVVLKDIDTLGIPGDFHFAYPFPGPDDEMGFRICTPPGWNGKDKLPVLVFLHGGWGNESNYLDENDRLIIRLAGEHGYLLVSPRGGTAAYGNFLYLPAEFGRNAEAKEILSKITPERTAAQLVSEKDVINVIEIALKRYPVDRKRMFLAGHSMGGGGTWYIGGKYPDYWRAIAPMSGPFVLEEGYPWKNLRKKPILITEGTLAPASLESSRELRDWLQSNGFQVEYQEVEADHPGMVPRMLPAVFDFFDRQR